ncbi:MAG: GTP cyclohydrolase FolE2 [bacterium]
MEDIQGRTDQRGVPIDRVGIREIKYPITVLDREMGSQSTIASINMYVDLSPRFKGTHMSRFIEILNEHKENFEVRKFAKIVHDMRKRFDSRSAHLELTFPYFIKRLAPVSKSPSLMEYTAHIHISSKDSTATDIIVGVSVPITTVCPCSKEISEIGAHNQRSILTIKIRMDDFVWIEEMIELAEECASCEIYPLLKREDEKFVTEKAHRNPVFVEDVVRNAAVKLKDDMRVRWFHVEAEAMESIHNHNAYASLEWDRNNKTETGSGPE